MSVSVNFHCFSTISSQFKYLSVNYAVLPAKYTQCTQLIHDLSQINKLSTLFPQQLKKIIQIQMFTVIFLGVCEI
jgi:hypothetical protein